MPPSENKERHFCFVYFGNRMNVPDFNEMHFSMVEGCCFEDRDSRLVQFIRISLLQKNGRRVGTIPRIIEEYNKMEGRREKIEPVVFHPLFSTTAVVCFKATAPCQSNPILARIAMAKKKASDGFWRWTPATGITAAAPQKSRKESNDRRTYTSIHDILREIQLPVSVQRAYSELSEPYFRQYQIPLGEGTGCVPVEHRAFIISEIKRLFEEELSYTEQPSVRVLPPQAHSLIEGDLVDIFPVATAAVPAAQATIRFIRMENTTVCRTYTKTGRDSTPNVDKPLGSFLTFYALQWNDACLESVCYPIQALHRGWIDSLLDSTDLQRRMVGAQVNLDKTVILQGLMLKIPSVNALLKLLCTEGLIVPAASTYTPKVDILSVDIESNPVTPIVDFFKTMLADGWAAEKSVQITAMDVIKVLNGGESGTYRQTCVRQFMKPFLFNQSVVGYAWSVGVHAREKYVVDVERVRRFISE
jgi:hypothetical protein